MRIQRFKPSMRNAVAFLSLTNELNAVGFAGLKTLADTLVSWQAEIGRMWRINRNNGITEGFQNKMEVISRRAARRLRRLRRVCCTTSCGNSAIAWNASWHSLDTCPVRRTDLRSALKLGLLKCKTGRHRALWLSVFPR